MSARRKKPYIYDVIVIGAGVSGIGAGIRLLKDGFKDFLILEKADDLGGTWRDNTYPGCECDVPSALYSYSFAQKPDWSRSFAGQQEILGYLRDTAQQYGIDNYIRYQQPVEKAQWDEAQSHWVLRTPDETYYARTIISCGGYLHEPIIPKIPGIERFPGKVFHSSRWDHEYNLNNRRVAVIGTGASAIQFVPKIQPKVKQLAIFQRTPQWVLPKPNRGLSKVEKGVFGFRPILNAWRQMLFGGFESFGVGFRRPALLRQLQRLGEWHLRIAVRDKALRKKLTPNYTLGCKRVLMSNDYYPALCKANVDLFASAVKEIRGNVVIGADGSQVEVDTIILGTGFFVTEPPIAKNIFDGQGRSLAQLWSERMQAYRGTTIAGLPNAFMVLGPNLGIGHNSAYIVIEAQLDYIMSALRTMRSKGLSRIAVRPDVQSHYNQEVQRDLQGTVWNTGGCSSYYLDKNGFNSVGFPWSTLKMRELLSEFDEGSYYTEQQATAVIGEAA
ncbi:MAG: NAD(P)/FAD-dependent oxidoreductase [Salinisphaeraceae bacterium]|nr:NAD(P)/FAD-dependent oxidoreductase [Salinisphaeraceae bacterium]